MNNYRAALVSVGMKIVVCTVAGAFTLLCVIFAVLGDFPVGLPIVFGVLAAGALFFVVVFFRNRVEYDPAREEVRITEIKTRRIPLAEIRGVETQAFGRGKRNCRVVLRLKDGKTEQISGYTAVFLKKGVKRTREIADELRAAITAPRPPRKGGSK